MDRNTGGSKTKRGSERAPRCANAKPAEFYRKPLITGKASRAWRMQCRNLLLTLRQVELRFALIFLDFAIPQFLLPVLHSRPRWLKKYTLKRMTRRGVRQNPDRSPVKSIAVTQAQLQLALGIVDDLRRRFARFKLGAHLLDLRCLLFHRCSESFNFLAVAAASNRSLLLIPRSLRCSLRNSLSNIAFTAS